MKITKTEITEYNQFEIMISKSTAEIIIKINLENSSISEISKQIKLLMKDDYLDRPGVYFLRLEEGFYVGKAKNLKKRFIQHYANKKIKSITFATYKSHLHLMTNDQISDLESLLISYARNYGLLLGNKRDEKRRELTIINSNENTLIARDIWTKFAQFNVNDLLEERNSYDLINDVNTQSYSDEQEQEISNYEKHFEQLNQNNRGPSLLSDIVVKKSTQNRNIDSNDEIFKFIKYREIITKGYNKKRIELFNKEYAYKALFMYLHTGVGNGTIDKELTKGIRSKGWLTAVTLAYFRIETNGSSRGIMIGLCSKDRAKTLIRDFVNKNF